MPIPLIPEGLPPMDDYDWYDALEDQALARLRDADARSEEETDEEEKTEDTEIKYLNQRTLSV